MPFTLFDAGDDFFRWIVSLAYIVLAFILLRVIFKTKQRQHLKWLVPFLISDVLGLIYRSAYNVHFFFGVRWSRQTFVVWDCILDIGECITLYSWIVLFRTLIDYMITAVRASPPAAREQERSTGAWPPAPLA